MKLLRSLRNRFLAGVARRSDLDTLYNQIAGLFQIQNAMQGRGVLRPLRGWAISPDAMAWVLADLQERTAPQVVEFGSGQSTVILAAWLKSHGGRALVSVEHDSEYSAAVQRQVTACGLGEQVQFVHAALQQMGHDNPSWSYDLSGLADFQVDVALVDGPPFDLGTTTRLVPLLWVARHLNRGGAIFLDDSAREAEQACLKQLVTEHPRLRTTVHSAEKGLVEIRAS